MTEVEKFEIELAVLNVLAFAEGNSFNEKVNNARSIVRSRLADAKEKEEKRR